MAGKHVPFEVNMDDCVMTLKTASGITVHMMDTYCRNVSEEQKRALDTEIVCIYNRIMARRAAEEAAAAGT